MNEKTLQTIMWIARRPDGYWSRAKIVSAIKMAYRLGLKKGKGKK